MQQKLVTALLFLGVAVLTARFLLAHAPSPQAPGREIVFTREAVPAPSSTSLSPLDQLQATLDAVSRAALEGDWLQADQLLQELEGSWLGLQPRGAGVLQAERQIDELLRTLQKAVWGKDTSGVLQAAQELTRLFARLTAGLHSE
ncbi:MAG TPA: hypothetical protein GX393_01330 [Firmicutes bacterium]|nr:hypothetical protein [Bacillota bacterium]